MSQGRQHGQQRQAHRCANCFDGYMATIQLLPLTGPSYLAQLTLEYLREESTELEKYTQDHAVDITCLYPSGANIIKSCGELSNIPLGPAGPQYMQSMWHQLASLRAGTSSMGTNTKDHEAGCHASELVRLALARRHRAQQMQ